MGKVAALIPAAGQGKRMGSPLNKQYLSLAGLPVLLYTLRVFEQCSRIDEIVVIASPGEVDYCQREVIEKYGIKKPIRVVEGGKERQNSVLNGLNALDSDVEIVVVHDGARPLLTEDILEGALNAVGIFPGVVVGVPVKDTVKVIDEQGIVITTPDRKTLWSIQTPQIFPREDLIRTYLVAERLGFLGTDDASLAERCGIQVKVVQGSYENIKITTPEDIEFAETIIRRRSACVSG